MKEMTRVEYSFSKEKVSVYVLLLDNSIITLWHTLVLNMQWSSWQQHLAFKYASYSDFQTSIRNKERTHISSSSWLENLRDLYFIIFYAWLLIDRNFNQIEMLLFLILLARTSNWLKLLDGPHYLSFLTSQEIDH